jgi:ribonuclease III
MMSRRRLEPAVGAPVSQHDDVVAEADRLERAEQLVGYRFRDRRHLLAALTHSSFRNERKTDTPDNERLEFVGDAVLSLVVVDELVRGSPTAGEGELTQRRAAHVSAEALSRAALALGLQTLLRTERGLQERLPRNVVADVVEAVLGAVWLDAGEGAFVACQAVVGRLLGPPPTHAEPSSQHAKRVLQERLQRLFGRAPDYVVDRADGPSHAPTFTATVQFAGEVLGTAQGKNKGHATEAAAAVACAAIADVDDEALLARFPKARR